MFTESLELENKTRKIVTKTVSKRPNFVKLLKRRLFSYHEHVRK